MAPAPVKSEGFVVLGAGLPRTGTNSMHLALSRLLGGPCYHMDTVINGADPVHIHFWEEAVKRKVKKEDWEKMLSGFRSGVDYPISYYYKDLVRHFPDVRVIMSTRKPDTWYVSVRDSIYWVQEQTKAFPISWCRWAFRGKANATKVPEDICRAIPDGMDESMFGAIEAGEAAAAKFFADWREEVLKTVPADRLLIHEAKDGYGPICEFLGLPVPDEPYPRVNDTKSMRAKITFFKNLSYAILFGGPAIVASALYYFM